MDALLHATLHMYVGLGLALREHWPVACRSWVIAHANPQSLKLIKCNEI